MNVSQFQSPFCRLPPELRLQIYEYVLGGMTIHFFQSQKSELDHCVCPYQGHKDHAVHYGDCDRLYCFGLRGREPGEILKRTPKEDQTEQKLPLLVTC